MENQSSFSLADRKPGLCGEIHQVKSGNDEFDIQVLNESYSKLSAEERILKFYNDFNDHPILCTSSFGITSGCLLCLISKINPNQKIHFIDTGNHFLEPHSYKAQLSYLLGLRVESVSASPDVHQMALKHELWKINAGYCCHIKKVKPFLQLKKKYAIWITGLQKWQTSHRSKMTVFEKTDGTIKFNPLIDMEKEECYSMLEENTIPRHPLFDFGYESVSCIHCTSIGKARNGRWPESNKTECGLHN